MADVHVRLAAAVARALDGSGCEMQEDVADALEAAIGPFLSAEAAAALREMPVAALGPLPGCVAAVVGHPLRLSVVDAASSFAPATGPGVTISLSDLFRPGVATRFVGTFCVVGVVKGPVVLRCWVTSASGGLRVASERLLREGTVHSFLSGDIAQLGRVVLAQRDVDVATTVPQGEAVVVAVVGDVSKLEFVAIPVT